MFAAFHRLGPRPHPQIDMGRRRQRVVQRAPQQAIFIHRAERIVVGRGDEIERARLQPVADADLADRAALPGEPRADADRIEHPVAGARHRRGTPVEPGRQRHRRVRRIDDDTGDAMRIERHRKRAADQTTAEDENVRCFHATRCRVQTAPRQRPRVCSKTRFVRDWRCRPAPPPSHRTKRPSACVFQPPLKP